MDIISTNFNNPADFKGIGPIPIPDDALFPYITVQNIMEQELSTHSGRSFMGPSILQVNFCDKNYEVASVLRDRMKTVLTNGATGTWQGTVIQGSNYMFGSETYDAEREIHMLHARFKMWLEFS
jgi:hypothetical protein